VPSRRNPIPGSLSFWISVSFIRHHPGSCGSSVGLPEVQNVGLVLFVRGAVRLSDESEAFPFIKLASVPVALESPEAQLARSVLGDLKQRPTKTATLRCRQHVKLVDPAFTKRNNANEFMIIEVTPEIARSKHTLSEEPSILILRVEPYKGGKGVIERQSKNGGSPIHVVQFELPEHRVSLKPLPIVNFTTPSAGMSPSGPVMDRLRFASSSGLE
jgi:hypothetical protein